MPVTETIVEFPAERIKAPFVLRCAAFCVDYLILLALPLLWFVLSGWLSENGARAVGTTVWILGILLFLGNFVLLPMLRGKTVGKALFGLTIVRKDGSAPNMVDVLRRNIFGYLVTMITFGIGFAISAVNSSGRALHDMIGGTIVVRGKKAEV